MIKLYPQDETILRAPNEPVTKFDKNLRQIINKMKECQDKYIGISAPQIGINKQILILRVPNYYTIINPEIIDFGDGAKIKYTEKCLSVPNEEVEIERFLTVRLKYVTYQGEEKTEMFTGLAAIAFQHEYDHLNSILICDYKNEK